MALFGPFCRDGCALPLDLREGWLPPKLWRTGGGSGFVCARQKWVVCARQTVGRLCTFLLCVFVIVSL